MEIVSRRHLTNIPEFSNSLFFYAVPPTDKITLQAFEEYASDRLKVLKVVEKVGNQHFHRGSVEYRNAFHDELHTILKESSLKMVFRKTSDKLEESRARIRDNTSHFILRLAYCKTEELRRWFVNQETELFRFRFTLLDKNEAKEFLNANDIVYEPVSENEKKRLRKQLISGTAGVKEETFGSTCFFKVSFTEVLELVRSRRIFIKRGIAYVPQNELVVCISNLFRMKLSREVAIMGRSLFRIEGEKKVMPVLSRLTRNNITEETGNTFGSGKVTANMVEGLSKTSFPLCMQELHKSLRGSHHLKHQGRLQYGLFLKGIGLTLEEALKFFRQEFQKIMNEEKFAKEYAYNIRYNYGQEGMRKARTPYNCIKIITSNHPSVGDHHGCPFKHSDVDILRQKLRSLSVPSEKITEIIGLVKGGKYQMACGSLFKMKHNSPQSFMPNHPNQYFDESQNILKHGIKQEPVSSGVKLVAIKNQEQRIEEDEDLWGSDDDDNDFTMIEESFHND